MWPDIFQFKLLDENIISDCKKRSLLNWLKKENYR